MENQISENEKVNESDPKTQYADMAVKFKLLFIVSIISVAIHIIFSGLMTGIFLTTETASLVTSILYVTLKMTADVIICVILFKLSRHNDGYKTAGILYLIYSVLRNLIPLFSSVNNIFQNNNTWGNLSTIFITLTAIFNLLYALKLSDVMISVFEPVSLAIKVDWTGFRQWNKNVFIATLICTPISVIPWIGYAALVASGIISAAGCIIFIWRFTIIFKSYKKMQEFSLS